MLCAYCAVQAHAHLDAGAEGLHRPPAQPARLPSPPWAGTWQLVLWRGLLEGATCIGDFLWHPWRPCTQPAHLDYMTAIPSECAGAMRSVLYEKVSVTNMNSAPWHKASTMLQQLPGRLRCRACCWAEVLRNAQRQADGRPPAWLPKRAQLVLQGRGWARYDARVEAMLDMGAAGVVESLLRLTVRLTPLHEQMAPLNARVCRCASGSEHRLQHASAWGLDRRELQLRSASSNKG